MEIQQFLGFIAVAQDGSFSKAAQRTHRTQPAISLQIRALEEELNTRLFNRLGQQKVTLTEDGSLFLDLIEPIVSDIKQVKERFNEARNKLDYFNVVVVTHDSIVQHLPPGMVQSFNKQFPKTKLSVVSRARDGILSMVKNDEAHIGLTSMEKLPAWAEYEVLGHFRRVLICSKKHPIKSAKEVNIKEIAGYPLIIPPSSRDTRIAIDQAFSKERVSYGSVLEVTGREAVKDLVMTGIGISILSEFYISNIDRKKLIVKDVSNYFGYSESGFLWRKGRYLNYAARYFMDLVRKHVKGIPTCLQPSDL
jgi:LysR family transcriptional regulator, putative pyruvate carboxylase regulator